MRNKQNAMGVGVAIGAGLGAAFGVIAHNLAVGLGCGMAIGVALGAAFTKRDKNTRSETLRQRQNNTRPLNLP